jgi:hypothetical protein
LLPAMLAARILDWVARRLAINIRCEACVDVPAGPLVWEDDGLGGVVMRSEALR